VAAAATAAVGVVVVVIVIVVVVVEMVVVIVVVVVAAAADMVVHTLITTLLFSSLRLSYFSVLCNLQCIQGTIFKIKSRGIDHSNYSISYSAVIERYFTYK